MNIAIFSDTYAPAINGVVQVINNLKRGLEAEGHKVFIVGPKYKNLPKEDDVLRIKSIPFPGLSEHRISWIYSRQIGKKFFQENKIDVIHSQSPWIIGMLAVALAKKYKIPHIHHYQTFFEDYVHYVPIPQQVGKLTVKMVTRWVCNLVDLVTVPSWPFKTILESYGVKKPIDLWVSGIDIEKFQKGRNRRKEWNVPEDAFVLSFVGRVAKEKNIAFLLELIPDIIKKEPNTYFLIAGDGPLRKKLTEYAEKLGIENHVRFLGYIDSDHVADVYASSDVFIFASVTETQGLVVLEAMAAGLPVVAVNAYGLKHTLQNDNGAYLLNLNHLEFLDKIFSLKNNKKLYDEKKTQALEYVKNFSYKSSTEKMITLYQKVIDEYHIKSNKKIKSQT